MAMGVKKGTGTWKAGAASRGMTGGVSRTPGGSAAGRKPVMAKATASAWWRDLKGVPPAGPAASSRLWLEE